MRSLYNRIVGQNLDRLTALSDGVFSVAMTLLVIDLKTPLAESVHSEHDLWTALVPLGPRMVTYLMSFLTLGIFWLGQQAQLDRVKHSDRDLTWLHLVFLALITVLPFSTRLLADFFSYRAAFLIYWANIFLLGVGIYCTWVYAERAKLIRDDAPPELSDAVRKRVIIAQSLYGLGALVGLVSVPLGIVLIILIQLNYAVAPRLPILSKL